MQKNVERLGMRLTDSFHHLTGYSSEKLSEEHAIELIKTILGKSLLQQLAV